MNKKKNPNFIRIKQGREIYCISSNIKVIRSTQENGNAIKTQYMFDEIEILALDKLNTNQRD